MTPPSAKVRLMGFPPVALVITVICGMLVWNCYQGSVPWLIGVLAVGIALQTFSSVEEVRRYKTWRRAWNAMNGSGSATAAAGKGKFLIPFVLIVALAFAVQIPSVRDNSHAIVALSLAAAFFAIIIGFTQKMRRRTKKKIAVAPVTWLVGRPRSSPSRSDASRTLPEYSARLLSRS